MTVRIYASMGKQRVAHTDYITVLININIEYFFMMQPKVPETRGRPRKE